MNWNRILSGTVAAAYILTACFGSSAETGFKAALFVVLPLACIWFSEAMASYAGPTWRGSITNPSRGVVVCVAGWLLLLLPLIIGVVYAVTGAAI